MLTTAFIIVSLISNSRDHLPIATGPENVTVLQQTIRGGDWQLQVHVSTHKYTHTHTLTNTHMRTHARAHTMPATLLFLR